MSSSGVTDFCPGSPTLHAMSGKLEAFLINSTRQCCFYLFGFVVFVCLFYFKPY